MSEVLEHWREFDRHADRTAALDAALASFFVPRSWIAFGEMVGKKCV
ncbi:hypothetical protein ACHIPZ_04350 [Antrihabitans sp. NCIMB 15449]|uniref:Uncharacterized protein n=1 Tax=Antrihabitans spumae TaxID=3373370 RepID=A0ABW7KGR3_9NOCA